MRLWPTIRPRLKRSSLYGCLVCGLNGAEGLEETGVGTLAELVEAPEVGHALGHVKLVRA